VVKLLDDTARQEAIATIANKTELTQAEVKRDLRLVRYCKHFGTNFAAKFECAKI
jgi:hypothetical protein